MGTDKAKINEEIARAESEICSKMPRLYTLYVFHESLFYAYVTIASSIAFFVILTMIRRSILNLISF